MFTLLRWRRDPSVRLLVATTHLARNPESDDAQLSRGFQYGVLFRELLAFAGAHQAEDVPVILTGDLNAKDCDELAGMARALVRLLKSPTHPLLWSVTDAPTSATTITEERQLRIDYILYQSSAIVMTGVGRLPRLNQGSPIPDENHPSDHLPVSARFVLKSHWAQVCACIHLRTLTHAHAHAHTHAPPHPSTRARTQVPTHTRILDNNPTY